MEIHNQIFKFGRKDTAPWLKALAAPFAAGLAKNTYPLRFSIVNVDHGAVTLEATTVSYAPDHRYADRLAVIEALQPRRKTFQAQPFGVIQLSRRGCAVNSAVMPATHVRQPISWLRLRILW